MYFFIFTFLNSPTLFISFFSQIWNSQALSLLLLPLISSFHGLLFSFPMVFYHSSFFLFYLSLLLIYFFYFISLLLFFFFFFHFPLKHLVLSFICESPLFSFSFFSSIFSPKIDFSLLFWNWLAFFFFLLFSPILPITTLAP